MVLKGPLTTPQNGDVAWMVSTDPIPYTAGLAEMESEVQRIANKETREEIWLLEHEEVYTLGSSGRQEDILVSPSIPVVETGRGGQVTYHGPGQRVGYVMLNLRKRNLDPRTYIHTLQTWVQHALKSLGIQTEIREGRVGLWVPSGTHGLSQESKLVAFGIRVRKGITLHGFAINVSPRLERFQDIVPCGLTTYGVTSCEALGVPLSFSLLDQHLYTTFDDFFKN